MLDYMAQDRPDPELCVKRGFQEHGEDSKKHVVKLKRIIRNLSEATRVHIKYKWQSPPNKVVAYCDSDWAGCTHAKVQAEEC